MNEPMVQFVFLIGLLVVSIGLVDIVVDIVEWWKDR